MEPLVSIIIPTHGRELALLKRAVQSALTQSYQLINRSRQSGKRTKLARYLWRMTTVNPRYLGRYLYENAKSPTLRRLLHKLAGKAAD